MCNESDSMIDDLIKTGSLNDVDIIGDEITPQDKEYMQMAIDAAKESKDTSTKVYRLDHFTETITDLNVLQVGAVIMDPKAKKRLGTGWNRMPKGCKEFSWDRNGPLQAGKHLYGKVTLSFSHKIPPPPSIICLS